MADKIRITSIPTGFPPDEIRKHWVGVEIPLADPDRPFGEEGDLNINWRTQEIDDDKAFVVNAYHALEALYEKAPANVKEWFDGQGFVFDESSIGEAFSQWTFKAEFCELVEGYNNIF